MKRQIIYVIMLLCFLHCNAQVTLDIQNKSVGDFSYPVIFPSMQNLMKLVDCNIDNFKATMQKYKYFPAEGYSGKDFCYNNAHLSFFRPGNNGKGVNTYTFDSYNHIVTCVILSDNMWPQGYIANWYASMRPYYTKTDGDSELFLYETGNAYYGFTLQIYNEFVRIIVQKFQK